MDYGSAQEAIAQAQGMTAEQASSLLELFVSGQLSADEGGQLLTQLAQRGETAAEIAAFVRGLQAKSVQIPWSDGAADCCGTGGSGRSRFNVSTAAAMVVSACGIPVAKHGNKGSRRPNGSFDLLEVLGVPLELDVAAQQTLLEEFNLTFCFARMHHPAMKAVVPYRQAAGGRSIFNLAGPLANPAGVNCQVVGVCDQSTASVVAQALHDLGQHRAVVVTGGDGWDEFVVDGPNRLLEVREDGISERILEPQYGYEHVGLLPGGDSQVNAALFHDLIEGRHQGPLFDLLCLASGAVIDTWNGRAVEDHGPGVAQAREALESGTVSRHFDAFLLKARSLAQAPI
ncbi:MAG: anthranilate phosphoribosyltransferase [Planctomycetota bacterium]|nr:MAG: anthranilate phosphoribosyltransferase [Planctomycetota bacterium]